MPETPPALWACPRCHTPLHQDGGSLYCERDSLTYECIDGIPRLLDPARAGELQPFIWAYQEQRAEEGWGTPRPASYYLNLPFKDTTGEHPGLWQMRAR